MPFLFEQSVSSIVERRHRLIVVSKMHVFESKLLLLQRARRQFLGTNAANDLEAVERQRTDLYRAEVAFRAGATNPAAFRSAKHGLWMYTRLVDRALVFRKRWTAICERMPAQDRFEVATDIQMLEDLIAQWRAKIQALDVGTPRASGRRASVSQRGV